MDLIIKYINKCRLRGCVSDVNSIVSQGIYKKMPKVKRPNDFGNDLHCDLYASHNYNQMRNISSVHTFFVIFMNIFNHVWRIIDKVYSRSLVTR